MKWKTYYIIVFKNLMYRPKGAGMTEVSGGIEYPLLYEILHTVSET